MSVYVDSCVHKLGRMYMCHMVADSIDELHSMADKIGVSRRHFQDKKGKPHYDVCRSKRNLAICYGAQVVTSKDIIRILKEQTERGLTKDGDA